MTRPWYRTALAGALILVLIPLSLSAQRITRRVFVSAVDAAGTPVLDLTAADFEATENGSKREVTRAALNAFIDTLIESDRRFLKTAPGQWPVFVIVTTDNGEARTETRIPDYNKFMNDFITRGGSAHAVIVAGRQIGSVTDLVLNLVENVGGLHGSINTANSLPERVKAIAERTAADHQKMVNRYEVDVTGDGKLEQPFVNVVSTREGVKLQLSPRRPF